MTVLPPWITRAHYDALAEITYVLQREAIPYVISGGLAGNLHGSTWPLHDIDLDAPQAALPILAEIFAGHLRFGPLDYADDEFELRLLGLTLLGVEIDISGAETVTLCSPDGRRHPLPTDLTHWQPCRLGALDLRVLPLDALLAYKRVIGRTADVRELEELSRDRA